MHGVNGRRLRVPAAVVATAFALAGCTDGGSGTPSTTSPTTATVPAPSTSLTPEQQAANEAKRAYTRYQRAIDEVYQNGGTNAKAVFSEVATNGELEHLEEQAAMIQKAGWRQVGGVTVRSIQTDNVTLTDPGARVDLSVCIDTSTRRAIDSQGKDVTRKTSRYFINSTTVTRASGNNWLVAREDSKETKSC